MGIKYNRGKIGKTLFLMAIIYLPVCVFGQGGIFSINISSDSIGLNELIKVDIKLENSDGQIEVPKFDGFRMLSGPNVSTQMSIVNGKKSQKKSYGFMLQPLEVGDVFIEETYLTVGDKVYTLESVPIIINPSNGVKRKMNISYAKEYKSTLSLDSGEEIKSKQKSGNPSRIKKRI